MKLYASGEDYLEAVLVLQRKQGMVRSVDLARHMGFSKPSMVHHRSIGCSAYKIFWIQGVPSRENHPLARWYCYDFLLDSSHV